MVLRTLKDDVLAGCAQDHIYLDSSVETLYYVWGNGCDRLGVDYMGLDHSSLIGLCLDKHANDLRVDQDGVNLSPDLVAMLVSYKSADFLS